MLHHPATSVACTPLVDKARLLVVHDTVSSVAAFLKNHHPAHWVLRGTGDSSDGKTGEVSSNVLYFPSAEQSPRQEIAVTYAEAGRGRVGIRVDVEVVPADAKCSSTGVAKPAAAMNFREAS
jgi:hypothetical protein